tara:strand:+ start:716 stop:1345 length:630 start_codon:yes stop_codon:yes gene_type:complete
MWGKVLAGVAIGVGAVAAAPFTGGGSLLGAATLGASLSGAGTIAAASGAGLAGAAAGKAMSSREERERRSTTEKQERTKAETDARLAALEKNLARAMAENDSYFRGIIALEAVAVACAVCDGDFSETERLEIAEFVRGMLAQNIPEAVKLKIEKVYNNPPTIKEAYQLAKESGVPIDLFDEVIQFVMEVDGVKEEEKAFAQAWNQLKAA